jgi:hypothetical protein
MLGGNPSYPGLAAADATAAAAGVGAAPGAGGATTTTAAAAAAAADSAAYAAAAAVDWSAVKALPSEQEQGRYVSSNQSWSFLSDQNFVTKAFNPFQTAHNSSFFEAVPCPAAPAPDYPRGYPMRTVLENWGADDTDIPNMHHDSFCRFDFGSEFDKIVAYKRAKVPFVITGMPAALRAQANWADLDYLNDKLGPYMPYMTDTSESNHFMFAKGHSLREEAALLLRGPIGRRLLLFEQWLRRAIAGHTLPLEQREHVYMHVDSSDSDHWLLSELPFFRQGDAFFDTVGKGVHCRFGMKGIISECHYDGGENYAVSMGGLRRWVMAHPSQCENLYLLPQPDVSARHSRVDWSRPDYERYPLFASAQANEVILQGGEVLYVPSYWFHFIVSLNVNFQCNCRWEPYLIGNLTLPYSYVYVYVYVCVYVCVYVYIYISMSISMPISVSLTDMTDIIINCCLVCLFYYSISFHRDSFNSFFVVHTIPYRTVP